MEKVKNLITSIDGDTLKLSINDEIGNSDFLSDRTSAKNVAQVLSDNPNAKKIKMTLGSFGGSMFQGIDIMNQLINHPAEVTTIITSIAGSATSLIALGGDRDKRIMDIGTFVMVHNPKIAATSGQSKDLKETAKQLEAFQNALLDIYVNRTGIDRSKMKKLMDAETFIPASEAIDLGFASSVSMDLSEVQNKLPYEIYCKYEDSIPDDAKRFFNTENINIQQVMNDLNDLLNPKEVDMKPEDISNLLAEHTSKMEEKFTNEVKSLTEAVTKLTDTVVSKDEENKTLTTLVNSLSVEMITMKKDSASNSIGDFIDKLIAEGRIFPSHRDREIKNVSNRSGQDQTDYRNDLASGDIVINMGHDWAQSGHKATNPAAFEDSVQEQITAMTVAKGVPKAKLSAEDMDVAAQLAWDKQQGANNG